MNVHFTALKLILNIGLKPTDMKPLIGFLSSIIYNTFS